MTRTQRPALALRTVLLLTGCAVLCWGSWLLVRAPILAAAPLLEGRAPARGQVSLETAVVGGCGALLLVCVLWAVGSALVSVAGLLARELAPSGRRTVRLARRIERRCPALVRRLVATALGITLGSTLGAGLSLPALGAIDASPAPAPAPLSAPLPGRLSGLTLPDRATGAGLATAARPAIVRRASPGRAGRSQPGPRFVDVHPGDSLWRIAQSLLRPGATDLEITRGWQRIQRVNADRIGADPDLIHPGTRLAVPPLDLAHRKDSP